MNVYLETNHGKGLAATGLAISEMRASTSKLSMYHETASRKDSTIETIHCFLYKRRNLRSIQIWGGLRVS